MRLFNSPPARLGFLSPVTLLATWFGSGLFRWAPGTMGSIAALLCGVALLDFFSVEVFLLSTLICTLLGFFVSQRYAQAHENKDPGEVVIDEVSGLWIAMCFLLPDELLSPFYFGIVFLLFRAFDILKPWPISWADRRLPGGAGIMMDDIIAGMMAGGCAYIFHAYFWS